MLARLRHHRIVGGDDEHGQVHTGGAGEHVLDEALVAGHIDDAEPIIAQVERGEADVDGDAAFLLLGQTVAVDAGQGLDERRLAVIDMAGRAEDQSRGMGASFSLQFPQRNQTSHRGHRDHRARENEFQWHALPLP